MKRHPALQDLARDHFHALVCSQKIRKAKSSEALKAAAEDLLELWRSDLRDHFREEEEVLLPILSRYGPPTENIHIRQMLDDHARLRDGFNRFEALYDQGGGWQDLLSGLGQQLEAHARLEDRIVFVHLESVLSEKDLDEISKRSRDFRASVGRPIGKPNEQVERPA